jgi:uncharacterized repeat protein (TIGR03803 family)
MISKLHQLAYTTIVALGLTVSGCGGGDASGGGVALPTPTPFPSPSPSPSPTPTAGPAASVSFLYTLPEGMPDGAPAAELIKASDGNYYGVMVQGGPNTCRPESPISCGAIRKVTPSGEESILYAFGSIPQDGYTPLMVLQASDGALYGVTTNGGKFGGGGVFFRVTLSGEYKVIYSWGRTEKDGVVPNGIVQGKDGNFYGTTSSGGEFRCEIIPVSGNNCGTFFKMTPSGQQTVLHSFGSSKVDGYEPLGTVVEGGDGNFYGITHLGGKFTSNTEGGGGTVFRITPQGALSIVHDFGETANDGLSPNRSLIKGSDGVIYGMTPSGGGGDSCAWQFGCGTIFSVTTAGAFRQIYAFAKGNFDDGAGPSSILVSQDGNLYGTAISRGANRCDSCGTVFRLTKTGVMTTLFSFGPAVVEPSRPTNLVEVRPGVFFGLNEWGGQKANGSIFFKMVLN